MQVAISCLVLINLTLKEPERNMFSAKEDRLDWIANRTYLAEWVRAWLLKPDYSSAFHFHALEKEMATHSSILAGESQGQRTLVDYSP